MPGHDEQGVVDADTQPDHAAEHRRPAGDVDDVGDQRHRADTDREPEHAVPSGRAVAIRDPKARNRMSAATSRPMTSPTAGLRLLEREEEVAAHLDPQRRSGRCLGTEGLEVAEVLGRRARPPAGTAVGRARRVRPATRPASSGAQDAAAARAERRARSAGQRQRACLRLSRRTSRRRPAASRPPGRSGRPRSPRRRPQLARLLGVEARHLARSPSSRCPKALAAPTTTTARTSHEPITTHGRRAARRPRRYRDVRHHRTSSTVVGVSATAMPVSVVTRRGLHIGRGGRRCPGRWKGERLVLSADAQCRGVPYAGVVISSVVRSLRDEPELPRPRCGSGGTGHWSLPCC